MKFASSDKEWFSTDLNVFSRARGLIPNLQPCGRDSTELRVSPRKPFLLWTGSRSSAGIAHSRAKLRERKVRESQLNGVSEIRVQWTFIALKTDPREICFSFSVVTSKSFRLEIVFHLTVAAVDRSPSVGCFMVRSKKLLKFRTAR